MTNIIEKMDYALKEISEWKERYLVFRLEEDESFFG